MADRNRYSSGSNQQGSSDYRNRQSEQFESDNSRQQGLNTDWNDENRGSFDRGASQDRSSAQRRSWNERDRGSRGGYDPVSDYDQAGSDYRSRREASGNTNGNYFTGDDFGGRDFGGDRNSGNYGGTHFGGNAMGGTNYARSGYSQYRGSEQTGDRGLLERAGDEVASWFGDEDAARRREQDHRGRGPGGYTRSDQRILEDVCDRLTEDRGVDASAISVTVDKGEVTLDGTVNDRLQKRRAEDCVEHVSGAKHVQNNLRVSAGEADTTGKVPPLPLI